VEGEKIRILLIEDNPGDARLLRELLAAKDSASFDLEHEERLSTGLARLAQGDIDVILLDLSLPDSHDLEGLGKILAQTLEVPIVVLSGLSDEAVAIKAVQEGAQDYLVKGSVDSDSLVRSLHYAIERQHLRVALCESESCYRLLADNVADVIWTADIKWRITYVSPSIKRLLGYTIEETMKLTINDILTHDSMEQARKVIVDQMEIRTPTSHYPPISMTLEHLRKDGSTLWAEVMLSFLWDKDGKLIGIMGATRDITERKKAEEALSDSQDRYRLLAENAVDVIWTLDTKGRLTYVNSSITRLLGYTVDEVMATKLSKFFTPASAETARKLVKSEMATGVEGSQDSSRSVVLEHVHKDGSTIWTEVVMSFLRDKQGRLTGIQGVTRDITERKKAEEALRESEARYRELFENANDVIYTHDLAGNFTSINKAAERVTGYTRDEALRMNITEVLPPEQVATARQMIARKVQEGGQTQYELEILAKKGHRVLLEVSTRLIYQGGKPVGVQGIGRDITERKKMEQELRLLSDAVRMTTDSVAITDMGGRILDINEAGLRMYGLGDRADFVGQNPLDAIAPEDRRKALENMAKIMETGQVNNIEYHVLRKDGSRIFIETSVSVIKGGNGEPKGLVAVARDITERRKMEEALRDSEERHRLCFENASDVIYSVDPEGTILSMSPAVERLLGYKPEELIGRNMAELHVVPPEKLEQALIDTMRALAGERIISSDGEFLAKDGSVKFGEISGAPIFSRDGKVIAAIFVARDITERRRMEEELRLLSDAVKMSKDSIVISNLEGRIIEANEATLKMHGMDNRADLIGRLVLELISAEDHKMLTEKITTALAAGSLSCIVEYHGIKNDGSTFLGEATISEVKDKKGEHIGYMAVVRDITERRKMEKALRDSEERLRRLVDHAPDIIFRWSVEKGLEYVSPVVSEITGYSVEELMVDPKLGLKLARGRNPDLVQTYERVVEHGITERTRELTFIRKDGKRAYLDVRVQAVRNEEGGIIAFEGIMRDITERRKMEEALKRNEQNYRVLFESTIDGMFVVDVETMKVVLANQALARMFGSDSVEDGIGGNPLDNVHPDDRDRLIEIFAKGEFGKGLSEIREFRGITKDGREIWVSAMGTRIEYEGKVADLVSLRDITERKRMEEEKQKMEEQLLLTGRLAAVGELAAGVAHELNNPITAIKGFAQLLTAREDLDETTRKDLDTIYRESQRAAKITQNLLSFARRHEPEKHPISINDVIENILEMQEYLMKVNNIELEVELDPDLPKTMADFHQMQQVFVNIINNAEQAMVETHGKGRLLIKTQRSGKMVQIIFADNGPGISEENLKRIFDPFFTTKEVGKGTGLGLSICYGLVGAHGGRIYARSKLGQGATFVVEMPIVSKNQLVAEAALLNPVSRGVKWDKPR